MGDTADYRPLGLPQHSIGFQAAAWAEKYLVQPDGPDAGAPWLFTDDQLRMLIWFYAVDKDGVFLYRETTLRQSKGTGKSIVAAVIAAIELCGPCRFMGWDRSDQPVGGLNASSWVVIAATSSSQTKNTMLALRRIFGPKAIEEFGLAIGQTVIHSAVGGRAETVTSSPYTMEGARATFTVVEESANWFKSNGGHAMFDVITRNTLKIRDGSARILQVTNAHETGADSVAEKTWNAYVAILEGRAPEVGQLYWAVEAPTDVDLTDREKVKEALRTVYSDSPWVSLDSISKGVQDTRTSVDVSMRYYFNVPSAAADGLVEVDLWDALRDASLELKAHDIITLGFDGSLREDSSALVAQRVEDRAFFLLAIAEKPEGPAGDNWEVDAAQFDEAIAHAFATYEVVAMAADVHPFETYIEKWERELSGQLKTKITPRTALAYDMRSNLQRTTVTNEALMEAIRQRLVKHNGNLTLRKHILNARRRPNRWGVSFGKESKNSPRKIDAYAALLLSEVARAEYIAKGEKPRESKMIVYR